MGDGSVVPVPIYYKDGRAAVAGRVDETGNATLIFLESERTQRFANKTGYRWYSQYRLPAQYGGDQITLRHLGNEEDAKRKLNRTENFRVIPRGDPDFDRLYARRGDAESINRALEDTPSWNRAHSVGHIRQEADMLGFALMVNSLTLARHRARERVAAAA